LNINVDVIKLKISEFPSKNFEAEIEPNEVEMYSVTLEKNICYLLKYININFSP